MTQLSSTNNQRCVSDLYPLCHSTRSDRLLFRLICELILAPIHCVPTVSWHLAKIVALPIRYARLLFLPDAGDISDESIYKTQIERDRKSCMEIIR